MLFATVYSSIIFYLTDQPWELDRYIRFTLVYILVTIVADGLGLLLGAIANPVVSCCICHFFVEFKFEFQKILPNESIKRLVFSLKNELKIRHGILSTNNALTSFKVMNEY